MPASTSILRRAFVDVCHGYSVGKLDDGALVYIRHLSHFHHELYDSIQSQFEQEAIAKGALTEVQSLERLYSKGLWSPAREKEIEGKRDFIVRLEEGRKTIALSSILKSHEAQIQRERDSLAAICAKRMNAIGVTAEMDAHRRLEDHYMVNNLFKDITLSQPLFDFDQFDNLTESDVETLHLAYKAATEPCSEENLRKLSIQDFFMSYYVLSKDNASTFFGKPVCQLTYYQIRLLNNARYMKSLVENTDMSKLTPEQRGDPDAIERLHITQKNRADMEAKGQVPANMSSADIKESGQQFSPLPPPSLSGVELVKWMQSNNKFAPR